MDEQPSCGRGPAQNTVVPAALAAVASGLAQNLASGASSGRKWPAWIASLVDAQGVDGLGIRPVTM